jgi:hypothetical protein
MFADELGERILRPYPPLQAVEDPPSPLLGQLLRRPFPAQTLAIMGLVKRWNGARTGANVAQPFRLCAQAEPRGGPSHCGGSVA